MAKPDGKASLYPSTTDLPTARRPCGPRLFDGLAEVLPHDVLYFRDAVARQLIHLYRPVAGMELLCVQHEKVLSEAVSSGLPGERLSALRAALGDQQHAGECLFQRFLLDPFQQRRDSSVLVRGCTRPLWGSSGQFPHGSRPHIYRRKCSYASSGGTWRDISIASHCHPDAHAAMPGLLVA